MLCLEGFLGNLFTCFRAAVALLFSQVRHIKRICLFNIYLLSSACHFRGHRSTITLSSLHHHYTKFWNINQMSFGAPFRVVLRSRLTPVRLTLTGKPWSCGVGVSRTHYRYLCLHLLFRALQRSLKGRLQRRAECSPTDDALRVIPRLRHRTLCPIIIHARPLDR